MVLRPGASAPSRLSCAALLVALLGVILAPHHVHAAARHATMVIDANSGAVLNDSAGDELRHPASLTKMMTLYLVFEQIEQGRLSYSSKIKMSEHAASAAPSKLGLDPGDEITVLDGIKALVTKSANDVAVAFGEHIGGTEARFAQLMTEKARLLGMSRTTFRNASGLPDVRQVTTARDMLTLALRLQDDFPKHYPLFAIHSFSFRGDTYRTHNGLLRSFAGTDGIKTGYTRMSGFNLVSSVRRGNRHVVGAVLGGSSAGARDAEMRTLLTRALFKASTAKTRKPAAISSARANTPRPAERKVTMAAAPASKPAEDPQTQPPPTTAAPTLGQPAAPAPAASISIAKVKAVGLLQRAPVESSIAPSTPALPPYNQASSEAAAAVKETASTQMSAPQLVAPPAEVTRRGSPPSTLQQQAANLAAGLTPRDPEHERVAAPQRASLTQGPHSAPVAGSATGPFAVQVGAYSSAGEAEKALTSALERASGFLASASPLTAPVQMGDRQLFRAQFSGFDPQTAAATCIELRRRQIDCLVVRAQ